MEELIFRYFLNNLENYASVHMSDDLMKEWSHSRLESPVWFNRYVNEFFSPELGVSAKELLSVLKQYKLTFKDYIMGIMRKFNYEDALESEGLFLESTQYEEASDDNVEDAKKQAIDKALGVEMDLDNLSDEELDSLLVKATNDKESDPEEQKKDAVKSLLGNDDLNVDNLSDEDLQKIIDMKSINEKRDWILNNIDNDDLKVKALHEVVGFTLKESKMIVSGEMF